jgi:hypothetical protein
MADEQVDTVEMRGWGNTTQSFYVRRPDGRGFAVTLDKKTTEALGREFLARAAKMED